MAELLTSLLEHAAAARGDHAAVEDGDETITYRQLHATVARLAGTLKTAGMRTGDRVGVLAPKSIRTVTSLYGVMWAGGGYVPLDPSAPGRRLVYMIRNCGMKMLIAGVRLAEHVAPLLGDTDLERLILLDTDQVPQDLNTRSPVPVIGWSEATAGDPLEGPTVVGTDPLAYILYTSGSTGEPKGVKISHGNALAFVTWAQETIGIGEDDRLSSHAPFHFDLSIFDLYVACRAMGTVVLVPEDVSLFPVTLAEWIERRRITVWYSVPSALVRLMDGGRVDRFEYSRLRKILFAGEVFAPKHLRAWMRKVPRAEWFNLYGPTETNVCTFHRVVEPPRDDNAVPIGKASSGDRIHLRDDTGQPITAPNRQGEIWVEGPTVALGYFGDERKTSERFVRDPLRPNHALRLYRTGDLASWNDDGDLVFQGRRDHMVKSRGYRIELGEIESAAISHPAVREVCVVAIPDEKIGVSLRACVVLEGGSEFDRAGLEQHLSQRLPRYMLPQEVVFLDTLPKTSTGKVDRRALTANPKTT